jgi:hypothetical protein
VRDIPPVFHGALAVKRQIFALLGVCFVLLIGNGGEPHRLRLKSANASAEDAALYDLTEQPCRRRPRQLSPLLLADSPLFCRSLFLPLIWLVVVDWPGSGKGKLEPWQKEK